MAKGNNNLTGRRMTTRNPKPYDANNSFVKKVATKVTDLMPQRSWISKWFNTSQGDGSALDMEENDDDTDCEEDIQHAPPLKRPRIRMDITHPPGTFSIQPRTKTSLNQEYSGHHESDFAKPSISGPSAELVTSTPAIKVNSGDRDQHQSDLSTLVNASNGANGMDDNSESSESTSGCSSLIPQINRQEVPGVSCRPGFSNRKKFMDGKLNYTNHLQSPRSLFIDSSSRDSLSSRKPSFNASIMTASMSGTSPLSSPFYSGNITFGGANAAGLYKQNSSLAQNSEELKLKVPKRMSVEVKPSNSASVDSSGMSQTAKKILEALEHFSSPITDAKKIPLKNINNMDVLQTSKKRLRSDASPPAKIGMRHLTRELNVPTVPDILRLRRRQKLQDTTAVARKIVSAHNKPVPQQEYHLRTTNDQEIKHPARLKAKSKSKLDQENTIEPVALPNIPLPITSLPNFQFAVPIVNKTKKSTIKDDAFTFASPIKVTNAANNLKSINNFTFSSPISAESKTPDSQPLRQSDFKTSSFGEKLSGLAQNFNWPGTPVGVKFKEGDKDDNLCKLKRTCTTATSQFKSRDNEIDGSMEKTAGDSKKSSIQSLISERDSIAKTSAESIIPGNSEVWECLECLIKNSNLESQCVACKASKPSQKRKLDSSPLTSRKSIVSEFKMPSPAAHQWECTSCYVRNKETSLKCVACETPKVDKKAAIARITKTTEDRLEEPKSESWECTGCSSKNLTSVKVCSRCNLSQDANKSKTVKISESTEKSERKVDTTDSGFSPSFKPSSDSWECPCCMVRNAASVDSCPCCNTSNPNNSKPIARKVQTPPPVIPGGFGDKFKKPEGAWNCDACMVQNKGDAIECVACTTPKPGATKTEKPATNAGWSLPCSFGMPANTGGFKFGIDNQTAKESTSVNTTGGFSLGGNQTPIPFGQTTFGIPPEEKKKEQSTGFSLATTNSSGNLGQFTFGIPPEERKKESGFSLTTGSTSTVNSSTENEKVSVKIAETSHKEETTFCVPKIDNPITSSLQSTDKSSATQNTAGFTFGIAKAKTQDDLNASAPEVAKPTAISASVTPATNTELSSNSDKGFKTPANPTFTFGMTSAVSTAVSTNTSTSSSTTAPTVFKSVFAFGDMKTTGKMPVSNFSQPSAQNPVQPSATLARIESPSTTLPKISGTETSASSPSPSLFNVPSPAPLFSSPAPKTTPILEENPAKPPIFAVPENKDSPFRGQEAKSPIFGSKLPMFGTEKSSTMFQTPLQTNTATGTSSFGAAPAKPATSPFDSSTPPTFGTSANFGSEQHPTAPNIFATTKANETTMSSPNLFTIGAAASPMGQTGGQPTTFNFSSNSSATAPGQKSLFTFGSSANTAQNNVFAGASFNNAATASSPPPPFTFNAPKAEPSGFAQTGAPTGIFGSMQNNSQNPPPAFSAPPTNTGFNFGSSATTPSPAYNFNPTPIAPASSEGFNFTAPSSTPQAFDPNVRPTFNFTGGNALPVFNAPPQLAAAPRKFKMAVRRKK